MTAAPDPVLLDLQGLKCPLPALHTRKALLAASPGATFLVLSTDPMSVIDVPHALTQAGGRLLSQHREGEAFAFHIVKDG